MIIELNIDITRASRAMTSHPWKAGGGSIAQFIFVNSECLFARISDADVPAPYVGTSRSFL